MRAKRKYEFEPDYAVPPGATLHEVMESLQMSQKELAQRTGLTEQTLTRIFKGDQPISYETANRLELVTGVPARMWNNLEAQYREQLAKQEERQRLEADKAWLKTIPIKELIERGYVVPDDDKVNLVRKVLAFFGVCSVQAQQIECAPFDKTRFSAALEEIRTLTREESVVFEPRMKQLCANAGVAVALVREMKKAPWNGATKWLTPNKAMILLSLRGKGEDKFWFSFFHEAGHVLKDKKKELFINDESNGDLRENKADAFAAETLIPAKHDARISSCRSKQEIILLADELRISPGIVAGRYQFLTGQWQMFKDLIRKLEWAD